MSICFVYALKLLAKQMEILASHKAMIDIWNTCEHFFIKQLTIYYVYMVDKVTQPIAGSSNSLSLTNTENNSQLVYLFITLSLVCMSIEYEFYETML